MRQIAARKELDYLQGEPRGGQLEQQLRLAADLLELRKVASSIWRPGWRSRHESPAINSLPIARQSAPGPGLMSNVTRLLPTLAVNGQLMRDFLAAPEPCFTLGLVEERRQPRGFLALRPGELIPSEVTADGFELGHAVLGTSTYEVVHFAFQFYGFATYHVLRHQNPALPDHRRR